MIVIPNKTNREIMILRAKYLTKKPPPILKCQPASALKSHMAETMHDIRMEWQLSAQGIAAPLHPESAITGHSACHPAASTDTLDVSAEATVLTAERSPYIQYCRSS